MTNQDILQPDYHDFRVLGMGKPSQKQIDRNPDKYEPIAERIDARKANRQTKRQAKTAQEQAVAEDIAAQTDLTNAFLTKTLGDTGKTDSTMTYLMIGGVILIGLIGVGLYLKKKGKKS